MLTCFRHLTYYSLTRFSLALLGVCALAWGQSQTGSMSGTIVDHNGAAVPDATVTINQDATGLNLHTVTSQAGLYVFPSVPVGKWTVNVERTGFSKVVQNDVQIFIA